MIARFGKVLNKNDIKHYTLGESWSILGELYHAERFNGGLIYNAFKNGTLLELLERILKLLLDMRNKSYGKWAKFTNFISNLMGNFKQPENTIIPKKPSPTGQ